MKKKTPKLSLLAAAMLKLMKLGLKKYHGRTTVVIITSPKDKRGVVIIPFAVLALIHGIARPGASEDQFQALMEALACLLECEISEPQFLAIVKLRNRDFLLNAAIAEGHPLRVYPTGEIETVMDGRHLILDPTTNTWAEYEIPPQ